MRPIYDSLVRLSLRWSHITTHLQELPHRIDLLCLCLDQHPKPDGQPLLEIALDAGERLDLAREQVEVGRREVGNRREQGVRVREQRLRDLAIDVRLPSALRGVGVEDGVIWLGGVILEREPLQCLRFLVAREEAIAYYEELAQRLPLVGLRLQRYELTNTRCEGRGNQCMSRNARRFLGNSR